MAAKKDCNAMLAEAEEREKKVKQVFDKYDDDKSGSIDQGELTTLMEELGLLAGLKTPIVDFVSEMFVKYDENDDDMLSFEEFKKFYNAAKDDAAGRKPPGKPPLGRTKTGLDEGTNAKRKALAEEKARKKAEEAEKIRKENAAMKAKLAAQPGRDAKGLDEEMQAARKAEAAKRKAEKDAKKADLLKANKEHNKTLKNMTAATEIDLSDEMKSERAAKAAAGDDARQKEQKAIKERGSELQRVKSQTAARTDNDLLDDVTADGVSLKEQREAKAAAGDEARQKEAQAIKDRQKELKDVKANTAARSDNKLS